MIQPEKTLHTNHPFSLNRRNFIMGCAACAACHSLPVFGKTPKIASPTCDLIPTVKPKVRLVFSHIPPNSPTWPYQGYDYEGRKKELLSKLTATCPNIEFDPVTILNNDQAKDLLKQDEGKGFDGYLVYIVGIWNSAPRTIAEYGVPTILVDDLYAGSGEFLITYSAVKREKKKVIGVSSSRFQDVVDALKCFECMKKMRASQVLVVSDQQKLWADPALFQDYFGTEMKQISSKELDEAYNKADGKEAQEWAKQWIRKSRKVVEPSHEEIEKSGRMYVAMKDLLNQHKAQAITIDCLGLFYGKKMAAYPCLGFFQFNNDGLVGACESDLESAQTMLLMTYLVGRPGFISDPVIDTSKNEIIYAHCVGANKVYGPEGKAAPYHIRSHSEDRKGAAVRTLLPLKEMTTTIRFSPSRKAVIMHQAETVANIDEDKACRTKLAAVVKGDINKLLSEWDRWGWHRVTFFGDYKKEVENISALLGLDVVMEA